MRLTIERIRTLVLAAGVLLVMAIAGFLVLNKWKSPLNRRDIPGRLGIEIQQEANGVTYTQAHGGNTIFKIHTAKVIQLRNGHAMLHDLTIELYGQGGQRVYRIKGDEFEYDQKTEVATAAGPVEITLMRPAQPVAREVAGAKPDIKTLADKTLPSLATPAPNSGPNDQIHVETSGLVFDQKSGVASTKERVTFSTGEGRGSSTGATYNSDAGTLVLDRDVEMNAQRGSNPVAIRAAHAEFDRNRQVCHLRAATADSRGDQAQAAEAQVTFRNDGSVERLDATSGFTFSTTAGSRLSAPGGGLEFDEHNQPRRGHLTGGVVMDSASPGRTLHGTSPAMDLEFTAGGDLRRAHLERGVVIESHEQGQSVVSGKSIPVEIARAWRSPVVDIDFRQSGSGRAEPATLRGSGGVVVTSETRRGSEAPVPSRLAADEMAGQFGLGSALTAMTGTGHAAIEETAATGSRQAATGDRLQARFAPPPGSATANAAHGGAGHRSAQAKGTTATQPAPAQIQSAELDGSVVLLQQPAAKPGAQTGAPLHATAGRAVYESAGQWLHLTLNPRIDDGGMALTADKVDVSQTSGDAFAHGNVKATWLETNAAGSSVASLGGRGPAHAVSAEAEFHQAAGEAIFHGHARLWQDANSIAAPLITISRQKQTLEAKAAGAAEPVVAVLLSAGGLAPQPSNAAARKPGSSSPSVIHVSGGSLWYSGAERKAIMRAAPLAVVLAQSGGVESFSDTVELFLVPAGAQKPAATQSSAAAASQVDRMNAIGHVVLTAQGRRGAGQQLAYASQTGDYTLTGTAAAPPRMSDPERGTVAGQALIFHSRDDSVSIEGGGQATTTDTIKSR